MKRKPDLNLLRNADSETAQRIAEEYPAEWDMERVFRRSYQKYLSGLPTGNAEESAVETDSPDMLPQKKPIRMYVSRYATAACLVLTAGVAGLIGYGLFSASKQGITNPAQSSELDIVIDHNGFYRNRSGCSTGTDGNSHADRGRTAVHGAACRSERRDRCGGGTAGSDGCRDNRSASGRNNSGEKTDCESRL